MILRGISTNKHITVNSFEPHPQLTVAVTFLNQCINLSSRKSYSCSRRWCSYSHCGPLKTILKYKGTKVEEGITCRVNWKDLNRSLDASLVSRNNSSSSLEPLMDSWTLIIVCTSSFNSYNKIKIIYFIVCISILLTLMKAICTTSS